MGLKCNVNDRDYGLVPESLLLDHSDIWFPSIFRMALPG